MNKFTLLSFESEKEKLLSALQKFQGVHFIDLQDDQALGDNEYAKNLFKDNVGEEHAVYQENLAKLRFSLDFIEGFFPEKKSMLSMLDDKKEMSLEELENSIKSNNWNEVYEELKAKERSLNELSNETTKLEGEIAELKGWRNLDIAISDLNKFKYSKAMVGTVSKQYEDIILDDLSTELNYSYVEIIDRDNQDLYLLVITHDSEVSNAEDILKRYGFSAFSSSIDKRPEDYIKSNKEKIEEIQSEKRDIKASVEKFQYERENLISAYEYFGNLVARSEASNNFIKTKKVVTICGWNMAETNDELKKAVQSAIGENYYLEFEEVKEEEAENVPIKLRNNGFASAFEGVIEMYSLPRYSEVDPTPILSVFYFLFFGMMLSDAGYGLIMMAASAFALYKVKDKDKRKSYKMFFLAGISTVIWGAIYGGWFGDLPSYFGIVPPKLLDSTADITTIFGLSLGFGVVHIFIGLGIKAYMLIRAGHMKDAIYDVFTWYITLIGAFLAIAGIGGKLGVIMLVLGLVGLLLTQGRTAPTIGGKIGWGIYGVYGITSYLGDIVSYSRLLALGLATGFIANALNLIINLIPSPFKYVLAPFLFIGLHTFNLLINALGSYVHAARLQYLEFFNKFYEGGGKKFTPYKLSDKYIKITK
ncbi:V-type ATP synthase subunit I [Clostridium yunnanense]|nr:V-type ATP synthase subunit I [Clostridium yunnanense]